MKSNGKTTALILIILGIFFAFSAIISTYKYNFQNSEYNDKVPLDYENLKLSKISGAIYINDNNSGFLT